MSRADTEFLSTNIYTVERENFGHTVVMCQPLDAIKPSKALKSAVVDRLIKQVAAALDISRMHGNKRSYVHVYMNGCGLKHYSAGFYKKLFKKLDDTYEDTLEAAYIYDLPGIARCAWDVLKLFIDPVTRSKIHIVSSDEATA